MYPKYIIMEDIDGGFHTAILQYVDQTDTDVSVPVYKQLQYHHTLESAKEEVPKEGK